MDSIRFAEGKRVDDDLARFLKHLGELSCQKSGIRKEQQKIQR